jgi:hypothetical protein
MTPKEVILKALKAAGRRGKALLDLRPLIITDLAARLGEPPVEK